MDMGYFQGAYERYVNNAAADEVDTNKRLLQASYNSADRKDMVIKDGDTFINNTGDADIEKGENFLYELSKDGLVLNEWIGGAANCFSKNCLFYGMASGQLPVLTSLRKMTNGELYLCLHTLTILRRSQLPI